MEIITYVRKGAITHKDSLGNSGRTEAGDVQVMSAGTGIQHAEYNLEDEETQLFQIWIMPDPQRRAAVMGGQAVPQGRPLGQVRAARQRLCRGRRRRCRSAPMRGCWARRSRRARRSRTRSGAGRHAYLVPATGTVEVNGVDLATRDGAAIRDVEVIEVTATSDAELVLVDAA